MRKSIIRAIYCGVCGSFIDETLEYDYGKGCIFNDDVGYKVCINIDNYMPKIMNLCEECFRKIPNEILANKDKEGE